MLTVNSLHIRINLLARWGQSEYTKSHSTIGTCRNILNSAASTIYDYSNELIIELLETSNSSLSSVSDLAMLSGQNAALVGNELIQFKEAKLIDKNTYKLSKLLRGRQGTEQEINGHIENERFILLNSSLIIIKANIDMINQSIFYKPVSIGSSLAETEQSDLIYTAKNLKPLAPVYPKAAIDQDGTINISWIRRARCNHSWRDNIDIPIGEESENYQIDILHNGEIIETLESTKPCLTYKNTENRNHLTAHIYQISQIIGRGYPTHININ